MLLENLWACVEPQQHHSANLLHLPGEAPSSRIVYLCCHLHNKYPDLGITQATSFYYHFTLLRVCNHLFLSSYFRVRFQASSTRLAAKQTALSSGWHVAVCLSGDQRIPQSPSTDKSHIYTVKVLPPESHQAASMSAPNDRQEARALSQKEQAIVQSAQSWGGMYGLG